jgi:hypothetical protein
MKNSTRTGEPEGVAVHTTAEPLNTAPSPIFVVILLVEKFTVNVKLVVLVTPPPVAVTVIVLVPVGVDAAVEMFKVREQVGLQEVDVVYDAVAPVGRPVVEKDTA